MAAQSIEHQRNPFLDNRGTEEQRGDEHLGSQRPAVRGHHPAQALAAQPARGLDITLLRACRPTCAEVQLKHA